MQRTPEIVRRSQAIEAELKAREERVPSPDSDTDELARKFAALKNDGDSRGGSPQKDAPNHSSSPVRPLPTPRDESARLSPQRPSSTHKTSPPAVPPSLAPSVAPTPAASGSTPSPPPMAPGAVPGGACLPVDELWTFMFPGFDRTTDASGREVLSKRPGLRILLLDVRPRPVHDAGHLRGADCVCIDPAWLRTPPVSTMELEEELERVSSAEAVRFAQRASYDLLVIYDENTRAFGAAGVHTPEQALIDALVRAIRPDLDNAPALLRGGFSSWSRAVGDAGVIATPGVQHDTLQAVKQSRVEGYRVPSSDISKPPRAYHSPSSRDIPPSLLSGGAAQRASERSMLAPPPPAAPPAGSVHRMQAAPVRPREVRVPDVRVGMSGLRNFGNTCYMNATLQCLSATVLLSRYMLDGTFKKAINLQNPLGTRGALAEAFAQLLRVMWSQQYASLSPNSFRSQIAKFAPAFGSNEQQDSQEFLTFLLDGLHEDLNLVQQRPPAIELGEAQQAELDRLPPQLASVAEWSMYRRRNDSVIVDAFQGQLRNHLQCLTCGKTSTTYNAFLSLSLPVAHGRGVHSTTLMQCLDAFVREEVLDKSNAWNCPRCKKPRRATKKLSLSRLPPILVVHLKRFTYKGPVTNKISTPVHFPTTGLDLSNYMPPPLPPGTSAQGIPASESQRPPYLYDLYAVTHHFGSLTSGHYTASIKNQSAWQYCDDSRIAPGDPNQLQSASPYVLFFRRRPRS